MQLPNSFNKGTSTTINYTCTTDYKTFSTVAVIVIYCIRVYSSDC